MTKYIHSGECGDLVYALPAVKAHGGGTVIGVDRPWTRPNFSGRIMALKRLLEAQDYIESVESWDNQGYDYDFTCYRTQGDLFGNTITERQCRWVDAPIPSPDDAWLSVDPDPKTRGKIVISRGERWHGYLFPWKQIVDTFKDKLLFIGLPEDHVNFCKEFGHVTHYQTGDLYDVATAIQGSEIFIGGQSSPNSICEGLKKRSILEVCLGSVDCVFHRKSTTYVYDGSMNIEILGDRITTTGFTPDRWPSDLDEWKMNRISLINQLLKSQNVHDPLTTF